MPIFDSGYPKNTNPDDADVVLTTDTSDSSAVKGVTLGSLWNWVTSKTDWITTAAIQDGAVTADKIDFTTFKQYEFAAYLDKVQATTAGQWKKVQMNETFYDPELVWDKTDSCFTAPIDGVYHFDAAAFVPSSNTLAIAFGSTDDDQNFLRRGGWQPAASATKAVSISTDIKLTAGQKVYVLLYESGSTNHTITTGNWTYINGHIVARL